MYHSYKPLILFKKIDNVILYKHLGFSFFKLNEYFKNEIKSIKFLFFKNQLDNVVIKIDQKNLYNLELQRKNKLEGFSVDNNNYSNASINFRNNDYKIKLRVKGDRALHFYKKDQTSYKIDLRGEDRIWGLEEFSVQKPITRNYIYEFIFHRFLEFNNLISLKYFFVNLSINDTDQGIYAVEEGFSKELIERNKKRNGPIFGIEETKGEIYPDIEYDLYSSEYWLSNFSDLTNSALSKLENIRQIDSDFKKYFDFNKWATYFAIIDLTQNYHGSIPKSVKLYYNPVTAKFEPIGFDGHYNSNIFNDFILLDFLDKDNINCDFLCREKEWFLKILNNSEFRSYYKDILKKISDRNFINEFININSLEINFYNDQFLSETSKYDKIFRKGIGPYLYEQDYLINRANYIRSRLTDFDKYDKKKTDSKIKILDSKNILLNDKIKKVNNIYYLNENLEIKSNLYLPKDEILKINSGIKLYFEDDFIIESNGSIFFEGEKNNPIIVSSKNKVGSFILNDGQYIFKNVIFDNLSFPKVKDKILHGGINIINSETSIDNVLISHSNSEDSINIISSKSTINNLEITNSLADGIDIDFGSVTFDGIFCIDINNDCLDVSSASVDGLNIVGYNIKDKGLSFGESSNGTIKKLDFRNSKLGIAVKDGSNLKMSEYFFGNNELDVAVFNKKKEYKEAKLEISDPITENSFTYLLGENNFILKNKTYLTDYQDNDIINSFLY